VPDDVIDLDTPHGPARASVRHAPGAPRAALLIGHGAGGSVEAPDILAATDAAIDAGVSVARVEQPYKVAGRKSAAPAKQLDAAWLAVHAALAGPDGLFSGLPILAGGRSSGARVACRTAEAVDAVGILCLAFPLHPPGKADDPTKSRLPELEAVRVPVLIIQGERDPFGMPPADAAMGREVFAVPGDHGLKASVARVGPAVVEWLGRVL
jgi:predicted alpha/beta-hydrolase family hydrolase